MVDSPLLQSQLTTVSMINLRLPLSVTKQENVALNLKDAIEQPEWFVEHKLLVPKSKTIVHSRDVLLFYVPRRHMSLTLGLTKAPYNFSELPTSISGIQKINDRIVNYEWETSIMSDTYQLRSVVIVEASKHAAGAIIGTSAVIRCPACPESGETEEMFIKYDPLGAGTIQPNGQPAGFPIIPIRAESSLYNDDVESFCELARKNGTVFFYVKRQW